MLQEYSVTRLGEAAALNTRVVQATLLRSLELIGPLSERILLICISIFAEIIRKEPRLIISKGRAVLALALRLVELVGNKRSAGSTGSFLNLLSCRAAAGLNAATLIATFFSRPRVDSTRAIVRTQEFKAWISGGYLFCGNV